MIRYAANAKAHARREEGYVLILAMLVLIILGSMAMALVASVQANQQHVLRDREYSQSLAVAEAGLNQYLWMVATGASTESNNFAIPGNTGTDVHRETYDLMDANGNVKGTYSIQVIPPSGSDSRITVKSTGLAAGESDVARTVSAHIGRPSFSQYILLVDDQVSISGPIGRQWHGKTHSNVGIHIATANINDSITCAGTSYTYDNDGSTHPGIWATSTEIPLSDGSRNLWMFPVPPVDFGTVSADFVRLNGKATGVYNLGYAADTTSGALGWYIKLLPGKQYQVAAVTYEKEDKTYNNNGANLHGGYITYGALTTRAYPADGVLFVKDDVWIEGTGLSGRITIASTGQLNASGKNAATSINVVGDITYSAYDGSVAVGLIAQNNVKIPMYAPMGKAGTMGTSLSSPGTIDMRIDAALIAQSGCEYVSRNSSSPMGPRRNTLTFYGSVSSLGTPTRITSSGTDYCGFAVGANSYDRFLLHNPPPFFPTIGTYQILDWQELPSTQAVQPET